MIPIFQQWYLNKRHTFINCNHHGIISQNVLVACNFDLKFIYVLSGWEGSAHDSKVLNDVLSRNNGLKVPQCIIFSTSLLF